MQKLILYEYMACVCRMTGGAEVQLATGRGTVRDPPAVRHYYCDNNKW